MKNELRFGELKYLRLKEIVKGSLTSKKCGFIGIQN